MHASSNAVAVAATVLLLSAVAAALILTRQQRNSTASWLRKPTLTVNGVTRVEDVSKIVPPTDPTHHPAAPQSSLHSPTAQPAYATICAIVKDQNSAIREWVYYHHWLGFHRIYLYDHNSTRPLSQDIADWIAAGVVVYTYLGGFETIARGNYPASPQFQAYRQCLQRSHAAGHTWAAFIDADEFLVLGEAAGSSDIRKLLREYERFGGLAVNWRTFGSSGHVTDPQQPILTAYTKCLRTQPGAAAQIKTIANVQHTVDPGHDPHVFRFEVGYAAVTEEFKQCQAARCPASMERIALHHYAVKSLAQFRLKMQRGGGSGSRKTMRYFHWIDQHANDTCLQGLQAFHRCCSDAVGLGHA